MSANGGLYVPTTRPAEERPHVCGKCRNPFTNGNPLCINAPKGTNDASR